MIHQLEFHQGVLVENKSILSHPLGNFDKTDDLIYYYGFHQLELLNNIRMGHKQDLRY